MGYTHYFGIKKLKNIKGESDRIEALYQKAIKDCQKIVKAYYLEHKGTESSLSGYTAHAKIGQYGGLKVNGKGKYQCEDFYMHEHFKENKDFEFVKTRRYFYDIVVTACLATLKFHLGNCFEVSSDGNHSDWIEGVKFANKVLRRSKNKVTNPIEFNPKYDLKAV